MKAYSRFLKMLAPASDKAKQSMVSYFDQTAAQCSQQLDLGGFSGEQFLGMNSDAIKAVREAVRPFHFNISATGLGVQIEGDAAAVTMACRIVQQILTADRKRSVDPSSLGATISEIIANALRHDFGLFLKGLSTTLSPKSLSQVAFLQTLLSSDNQLIIGLGLTGTGKTHLAIAAALNKLAEERVRHVLITRPHVVMEGEMVTAATRQELEADSQLDYFDDILHDLVAHEEVERLKRQQKLEVVPLGRLRGRTFNNTFIILDEAQNTTVSKMRMAVTRIGRGSRMVVTGDPTNAELFGDEQSGLVHLLNLLQGTDVAKIHQFESDQIIRNSIVNRLEELYAGQRDGGQEVLAGRMSGGRFGKSDRLPSFVGAS